MFKLFYIFKFIKNIIIPVVVWKIKIYNVIRKYTSKFFIGREYPIGQAHFHKHG